MLKQTNVWHYHTMFVILGEQGVYLEEKWEKIMKDTERKFRDILMNTVIK